MVSGAPPPAAGGGRPSRKKLQSMPHFWGIGWPNPVNVSAGGRPNLRIGMRSWSKGGALPVISFNA